MYAHLPSLHNTQPASPVNATFHEIVRHTIDFLTAFFTYYYRFFAIMFVTFN
jgi:hypothetical protein